MRFDDAERVAFLALRDEIRDHGRRFEQTQRFQRDQLRVAGADAECRTDVPASVIYSASEASALTAAAAIALPPRRPSTIT